MNNELVPIQTLERMAQAISGSKLFGVTNPEQALALMLVAQAEGLHPATAARDYHIIQGRPALKADAMLARYLQSGGRVEWHEHTDQKVAATFTHPAGGSLRIDWDFARAKQAGLGNKDMWLKYPRQMLRARVISEGIRATNPAVASGIYTPEEVEDMEPSPRKPKEKDMGAAEIVTDWNAELASAGSLESLGEVWKRIPKADKPAHIAAKDSRKAAIEAELAAFANAATADVPLTWRAAIDAALSSTQKG